MSFQLEFTRCPWRHVAMDADEFLTVMSDLGFVQEMSMVGAFAEDPDDKSIRTAHRDTDLPWHRDGIYTEAIAAMQDGEYVERPNVDVVGMYCVRENPLAPCWTTLSIDGVSEDHRINLHAGEALVWDNRLWHGREGPVGERLLVRFWTTLDDKTLLAPATAFQAVRP